MIRLLLALMCLASISMSLGAAEPSQLPARPNIVLIIADDLGAEDLGVYGNTGVRTPNLDKLAGEGLRFTRAFNACSSCSPSRASMITGRYPHSTGAERLHMPLPKEQVTFVEKLKAAGYWTAASGKWHLGPAVKDRFDIVVDGPAKLPSTIKRDGSGCEGWVPTLQNRPKDKPFFAWLAALDPHRDYKAGAVPEAHDPGKVLVPPYFPDTPEVRSDLVMYYDEIARLDSYVGKVIAELQAQGVLDNTAIFFVTDNGRPFPRCKTTDYDSGIQTPLLIRWPAVVKSPAVSASLVSTVDLAPTFLELAGVTEMPAAFQGKSFARVLTDPSAAHREHVFAEHNWHDYTAFERAVRTSKFKYIRNAWTDLPGTPPADAVRSPTFEVMKRLRDAGQLTPAQMQPFEKPRPAEELYDVEADPHELKNLASDPAHARTLSRLRQALDEWQKETSDTVPAVRPPDGFDRETGRPLPGVGRPSREN